jgi:drug/metabolite transporter (DMT)-like permease
MTFTKADIKRVAWTAAQAFLGAFLVLAPGVYKAPNMSEAKAALVAAVIAGVAAAVSAVKNAVLTDASPAK